MSCEITRSGNERRIKQVIMIPGHTTIRKGERRIERTEERDPPHIIGCVCADCSGAELTADND